MKRPAPVWNDILVACQVKPTTAAIWSEVFAACIEDDTFSAGDEDLRNFLGQILHESTGRNPVTNNWGPLEAVEENLNYSAEALARTWPNRYARRGADGRPAKPYRPNGLAQQLHYRPQDIANNCYANRMGNGPPESGDGFKYRGGGLGQCTGKDNYAKLQRITGLPLVEHPELIREPYNALRCSILLWEAKVPDEILHDPEMVSREWNGGDIGLEDRLAYTERVTDVLQRA